jgi:hypothetical protein
MPKSLETPDDPITPEVPKNEEQTPTEEQQLSPEVVKKIMAKVKDINGENVAFSQIDSQAVLKILQEGLLGADWERGEFKSNKGITKELWKENIRNRRAVIHFQIVGRIHPWDTERLSENRGWSKTGTIIGESYYSRPGEIFLLFDLEKFQEIKRPEDSYSNLQEKSHKFKPNTYFQVFESLENGSGDGAVKNKEYAEPEHGFVLSSRVAPRFFEGIVLFPSRNFSEDEINKKVQAEILSTRKLYGKDNYYYRGEKLTEVEINQKILETAEHTRAYYEKELTAERDKVKIYEQILSLIRAQMDVYKDKSGLMQPVYDVYGNLLWPKQMSYEEVKKFVAEREAKKKAEVGEKEN